MERFFKYTLTALISIVALMAQFSRVENWRGALRNLESSRFRRLSPFAGASIRTIDPFPVPASSNAACGFPALRFLC